MTATFSSFSFATRFTALSPLQCFRPSELRATNLERKTQNHHFEKSREVAAAAAGAQHCHGLPIFVGWTTHARDSVDGASPSLFWYQAVSPNFWRLMTSFRRVPISITTPLLRA